MKRLSLPTLKYLLVVLSFSFLFSCGGGSSDTPNTSAPQPPSPPPSGGTTPPATPDITMQDIDIIRFLTQSTFGVRPADYQALRAQINADGSNQLQVYENWIDAQIALPQSSMLEFTDLSVELLLEDNNSEFKERRDAFWTAAVFSRDQLRQRMAFALSQILVVSETSATIRKAYRGTADYWDMLGRNAFGHYNQALLDTSIHPIMGIWLSHIKNRKANPELGFFPDENYAREIMQLFSFGLVHRERNGTIKLDENNAPIATYDNNVIQQMARVFTGLSYSAQVRSGQEVTNTNFDLNDGAGNNFQYRWIHPMRFFPQHHDFGEKTLFSVDETAEPIVIPSATENTQAAAMAELVQVIDAIVAHRTTAPYIARQLIQRFVTSNPSANYIERVATAFGETGDLTATLKAILLDPEAREPNVLASSSFGKAKDPILHITALLRLLNAHSNVALGEQGLDWPIATSFEEEASWLRLPDLAIGQQALGAPSVFNFFSPDFSPSGELAVNSLVAPELQLMSESQLYSTMNAIHSILSNRLLRGRIEANLPFSREQLNVSLDTDVIENLWSQTEGSSNAKATAVVDYFDLFLNAGQLKRTDNNLTREALITEIAAAATPQERASLAIYGTMTAPEFFIQR